MACLAQRVDSEDMTPTPSGRPTRCTATVPAPRVPWHDQPAELAVWRSRHEPSVRARAAAPIRYLPAAFLDALQGSWGDITPIEPPVDARPALVPLHRAR